VPKGENGSKVLLGEPEDRSVDVGAAVRKGEDVRVKVFSGTSVLSPGSPTDKVAIIGRILSPVTVQEAGTIRCIGLNVSITFARRSLIFEMREIRSVCINQGPPPLPNKSIGDTPRKRR